MESKRLLVSSLELSTWTKRSVFLILVMVILPGRFYFPCKCDEFHGNNDLESDMQDTQQWQSKVKESHQFHKWQRNVPEPWQPNLQEPWQPKVQRPRQPHLQEPWLPKVQERRQPKMQGPWQPNMKNHQLNYPDPEHYPEPPESSTYDPQSSAQEQQSWQADEQNMEQTVTPAPFLNPYSVPFTPFPSDMQSSTFIPDTQQYYTPRPHINYLSEQSEVNPQAERRPEVLHQLEHKPPVTYSLNQNPIYQREQKPDALLQHNPQQASQTYQPEVTYQQQQNPPLIQNHPAIPAHRPWRRLRRPPSRYIHPYRRKNRQRRIILPSKLQELQRIIRTRFDNHIKRRQEIYNMKLKGEEDPKGMAETFMSSAMLPVSFMAFSMIFMDIMGRMIPWPLGKRPTTTTTPPPKITKVEYNPPKIPTIGDLLGGVKDKLKGVVFKKKKKKKKWMDSSEEQSDDHRSSNRKRKIKVKSSSGKKKKKKKYNSKPMSLKRLQELYAKMRPSFVV